MKSALAGCILFLLPLFGLAQTSSAAKTYLNYYFDRYSPIERDLWKLSLSIAKESDEEIDKKRSEVQKSIQLAIDQVKASPAFEGDTSLKTAVLKWLFVSRRIATTDYDYLQELRAAAKSSPDQMRTYVEFKQILHTNYQRSSEALVNSTRSFAESYGIAVIEEDSKLAKKLNQSYAAYNYYDQIYLGFFDAYFEEAKFNKAVNSRSHEQISEARYNLKKQIAASRIAINKAGQFENNADLQTAALAILSSYEKTVGEYGSFTSNFFQLKQEHDSMKVVLSKQTAFERKPEEVNHYNGLVKEFNAQVPQYKLLTQQFNQERRSALSTWNQAVNDFIEEFVR